MNTTPRRSRQPKGTTTGGQFSVEARAEAALALSPNKSDWENDWSRGYSEREHFDHSHSGDVSEKVRTPIVVGSDMDARIRAWYSVPAGVPIAIVENSTEYLMYTNGRTYDASSQFSIEIEGRKPLEFEYLGKFIDLLENAHLSPQELHNKVATVSRSWTVRGPDGRSFESYHPAGLSPVSSFGGGRGWPDVDKGYSVYRINPRDTGGHAAMRDFAKIEGVLLNEDGKSIAVPHDVETGIKSDEARYTCAGCFTEWRASFEQESGSAEACVSCAKESVCVDCGLYAGGQKYLRCLTCSQAIDRSGRETCMFCRGTTGQHVPGCLDKNDNE